MMNFIFAVLFLAIAIFISNCEKKAADKVVAPATSTCKDYGSRKYERKDGESYWTHLYACPDGKELCLILRNERENKTEIDCSKSNP